MKGIGNVCLRRAVRWILPCLIILLSVSCKDPFEADSKFKERNFLVVEGYINVGLGVTQIKLSRTTPLDEPSGLIQEPDAEISIESSTTQVFALQERTPGVYSTDSINLPAENQYRIVIKTSDQEQYASAFVTPIKTPPIDSVTWSQAFEGVTIAVSTHDPENSVQYYQWQYDETWEIHSYFTAIVRWEYPNLVPLTPEETENLYRCWTYHSNSGLLLASTEALSGSIIRKKPLIFIPAYIDDRLTVRYSALIRQHALSEEEFSFLQILIKNTSDLGTFFDAQPSQLFGNIKSLTSNKQVVGYVGAYSTESKQLFIINNENLAWRYTQVCTERQIGNDSLSFYMRYNRPTNVWAEGLDDEFIIKGAYVSTTNCVDCHSRNGTNIRPSFWPTNLIE